MSKVTRLAGIDLCRGLAAFAVILVHSGDETWNIPISEQAIQFRHSFYYAVPFFLAASFYFGTKKSPLNINTAFWRKKLQRIVLPYLLWSVFYTIAKTTLFLLGNDTEQVRQLLSDPVAIIFAGAASYHLYFIPLLLAGNLLLYLADYLNRQQNSIIVLTLFSALGIIVYQLLMVSHNDFDLGRYIAFPNLLRSISETSLLYQPWRIVLINLAWIIRCLPYFSIALLINRVLKQHDCRWLYKQNAIIALFLCFLLANIAGRQYLAGAVSEIIIAYSLLLFGVAISQRLPDSGVIANLGNCSFGIYLVHPIVKSAVEIVLVKLLPQITQSVSIVSMLIYSLSGFLLSWVTILLMQKNKLISQYM